MPAHSYRVNNCGTVDLLLDKFVFNTPPGIKHIANLVNFGGASNFSGTSFTVPGVSVSPDESKNFTIDYEYVSGPACCRFGNIVISTVTGKINTIFSTINVSDQCTVETVIATCSITPAQSTLTFNVPAPPTITCSLVPNQAVWNLPIPVVPVPAPVPAPVLPASCSLTPNQAVWSVPIPLVPTPPIITCSLTPVWGTWAVTIPSGAWSLTNGSATSQTGGSTFIFNWTAPNTAVGSRVSWYAVNPGTTTTFNDSGIGRSYLGSANNLPILASQSGTITVLTNPVSIGDQNFQIIITNGTTVLARSPICTIKLPATPSYTISSSTTSVREGDTVTFNFRTSNVPDGTRLWWAAIGIGGASPDDASNPKPPQGSVTVINNQATVSITVANDLINPETGEGFTIRLYDTEANRNNYGIGLAESSAISIINVPPPVPTYTFDFPTTTTSVREGDSITFRISTTNVSDGTVVWWAAIGIGGASPPDAAAPQPPQGSATVVRGFINFAITVARDLISPETGEGFTVRIYNTQADRDTYGPGLIESPQVFIIDVPV